MKKYRYKLIADILLMSHILWVFVLVGGTFFFIYNPWYIPYHIGIVSGTLLLNLVLGGCPLTWWEERYRRSWDPGVPSYENSFVATQLKRILGIELTAGQVNWLLFGIKAISYYLAIAQIVLK